MDLASLWPWLLVAGAGALHGLNPLAGWPLAAAWGLRALGPLAIGHTLSVALVAGALALGLSPDRGAMQAVALGLLGALVAAHLTGCTPLRARTPARHAGLALGSFVMASAHGAGLMLVPALLPLCVGAAPASGIAPTTPLGLALAAVAVHTTAMLAVAALMAIGAARLGRGAQRLNASVGG